MPEESPFPGYEIRMTFPNENMFDMFLEAKIAYIDLINANILIPVHQDDGTVILYGALESPSIGSTASQ